jgi:hypothetical protein
MDLLGWSATGDKVVVCATDYALRSRSTWRSAVALVDPAGLAPPRLLSDDEPLTFNRRSFPCSGSWQVVAE